MRAIEMDKTKQYFWDALSLPSHLEVGRGSSIVEWSLGDERFSVSIRVMNSLTNDRGLYLDHQGTSYVFTRDFLLRLAYAYDFLGTSLYRELDDWLETLEEQGDVQLGGLFVCAQTPWEAQFRETFVGTRFFSSVFNTHKVHIEHAQRNIFKISYGQKPSTLQDDIGWRSEPGIFVRPGFVRFLEGKHRQASKTARIRYDKACPLIKQALGYPHDSGH